MALKINMDEAIEPVRSDSPTGRNLQPQASPAAAREQRSPAPSDGGASVGRAKRARRTPERRARQARQPKPRSATELTSALAAAQKPIATRMASELWEAAAEKADRLDVPLRLLLTDAVLQALELPDDEHRAQVRATERREKLAQVDAL